MKFKNLRYLTEHFSKALKELNKTQLNADVNNNIVSYLL